MDKGRIEVHAQRIRYLQRRLRREASPLEDLQARSCQDLADLAAQLEGELDAELGDAE